LTGEYAVGKRRKGRDIVLQSSYASLISGSPLNDVLEDQLSRRESADETVVFARDLASKVSTHFDELKRWLGTLISDKWDPNRLGVLERAILTMGLAELKYSPDVPYRVAINEALELTRRYCDEQAVGFVNGILDRAAAQVYPDRNTMDKETP
jgi:transcription antitermination protein NusB